MTGTSRIASLLAAIALLVVPACTERVASRRDSGSGALDASALDASALDASALDASGLDAAGLDAAPLDGARSDAAALDASVDARVVDATSIDGSRLDSSVRDASSSDAARDAIVAALDARPLADARPFDAGPACPAPSIGLFAADDAAAHDSVRGFLMGTGMVGTVTVGGPVNASFTPTLAQLMTYDVVFVWGSDSWDGTAFGDVLASYLEAGGGVVVAVFAQREGGTTGLAGRIESAGYLPYVPSGYMFGAVTLGEVASPFHPIMAGVTTFGGDSVAYHDGPISGGATLIASLSNGRPLVATMEPALGRTVLLGLYPVRLWDTTTDGSRLMANALRWAACR